MDATCLNCGAALPGEFCSSCGQKRPHTDLTLGELVRETTSELTHWEGKVPQTIKVLLTKPGALTRDFLAGRRARWLPPLRVYIICSLAFFVAKPVVESLTNRSARDIAQISISSPEGATEITPEARAEIEQGLPARIFGTDRLIRAATNSKALNREIDQAFPKAMFILLPLFALFTHVAWRKQMPRYPGHLYIALHVHAAWFAALFVSTLATGFLPNKPAILVGVAMLAYMTWYAVRAFKNLYGQTWGRTLAKSAAVAVFYMAPLMVMSLTLLGLVIFMM